MDTLTLSEAAALLEISMAKLRKLIAQGDLVTEVNPLDRRERLVSKQAVDELLVRGRGAGRTRGRTQKASLRRLRARSPLVADADDLVEWSSRTDAGLNLPRLIRRLILEAGEISEPPRVRAGEGVLLSGWDGISVFSGKHPYVPQGTALWEMGRDKAVKAKADKEYAKRLENPLGFAPALSTFVFVTPRRWPAKLDWQGARRRERRWRDVRAYDADDLEAWMEIAPVTRIWFSRLIGKALDGAEALDDWWSNWCQATSPKLSSAIVLAGAEREDTGRGIQAHLAGDPSSFAIQADSTEEAIAVLTSAIHTLPEDLSEVLTARAVVVRNAAIWPQLITESRRLLLIPDFPGCEPAEAVRAGHTVVTPVGRGPNSGGAIEVPRLRRQAAESALIDAGVPEEDARRLATLARRSLQALRRRIAVSSPLRQPDWCTPDAIRTLVPVLLAGHWQGDAESDQAVLSELSGRPYEELERDLATLANVADPPVRWIGGAWLVCDRFDLWKLIGAYLIPADLDRFHAVFEGVFAASSRFDREIASVAPHWPTLVQRPSAGLREALAECLALIASEDVRVGHIRGQNYANALVRAVLNHAAPGAETIWPTLSDVLPLLAESAPDVFLAALATRIDATDQARRPAPEGDMPAQPLNGAQSNLLWALETLAWNRNYLDQVTLLLAKLSRLSSKNPQIVNSPDATLRSIYLAWLPATTAVPTERFSVIDRVAGSEPEVIWQLLRALLPRPHDVGHPSAKPRWRPWVPDRQPGVLDPGHQQSYEMVLGRLLLLAEGRIERWLELFEDFDHLPMQFKQSLLERFEADSLETSADERAHLWDRLRALAAEHKHFSDAFWRMSEEQLQMVERLAERYEPDSVIDRVAWMFGKGRHRALARQGSEDHFEALQGIQTQAAKELMQAGGLELLLEAAAKFEEPFELGLAVGRSSALSEIDELEIIQQLTPSGGSSAYLALGFVAGAFGVRGWTWVGHIAARLEGKLRPDQWGTFLTVVPPDMTVIDFAERQGPEVAGYYWHRFRVWARLPVEALERAGRGLLRAGRARDLVVLLGMNIDEDDIPSQLIADALENATVPDGASAPSDTMYTYYVTQLLDRLAADKGFDRSRVARLEWSYSPLLRFERPPGLLHERLQTDPSFFVEVVATVFRGENELETEVSTDDSGMATRAFDVLESWHLLPGQGTGGSIDEEALVRWIDKARELLAARDRLKIGDLQIGKLLGKTRLGVRDGVPAAAVCSIIERIASSDLERGVETGVYNARGATMRGLTDGGQQERLLAATYRTYAEAVRNRWPRTAGLLGRIADIYDEEAVREDIGAELTEDMWR